MKQNESLHHFFKLRAHTQGTGDKVRVLKHQQSDHSAAASVTSYLEIQLPTKEGISLHDITPQLRQVRKISHGMTKRVGRGESSTLRACMHTYAHAQAITEAGVQEGWVNVVSRHTTTAVTLNECESRLMDDVRQFLLKLAPPSYPYLHNDIHLRPATEDVRSFVFVCCGVGRGRFGGSKRSDMT